MIIKKTIVILITTIFVVAFNQNSFAVSFNPSISLSEEYNDNIYLANEDGNKVEDWITIVTPGFVLEAKTRKAGILVNYDISHSIYKNYSENDSFRHNSLFDSWYKLSKHTEIGLSNRFIKTEETLTGEDSTGIRNEREPYYSNSSTVDIDHTFGDKRSINIAYSYKLLENEDETIEDNYSHKCSLFLRYNIVRHLSVEQEASYENGEYDFSPGFVRIKSRTRLTKALSSRFYMFVEYTHTDYNEETTFGNDGSIWGNTDWSFDDGDNFSITDLTTESELIDESYRVYHPSSGFGWTFEEGSSLSVNVGYFMQERDSDENESGVTIDGNLGKQWKFKRGLISITGNSGYEDTQLQSENLGFNIYYQGMIGCKYSFTRNLQSLIDLSYRSDNYVNSDDGQGDRKDDNYNLNANISWHIKKWLNTSLAYSYTEKDSNFDENDYIENKVTLRFSLIYNDR